MKKICMATILSAALLLGACSSTKLTGNLPESPVPSIGVNQPGTDIETDKTSYETNNNPAGKEANSVDTNVPKGITVNIIDFDVLTDNIPGDIEALIDSNKGNKGYIAKEIDGVWYVVIFMGEQLTGGYSVEVSSIEDNEGKTIISVNEENPADDAIVMMALTYPYQVIKINDGIAPDFTVVDQGGDEYPEIK